MPMSVDRAASTAAGRFTKGAQMTISAWVEEAAQGENWAKKSTVCAAVLYIFQLPAITGLRIAFRIATISQTAGVAVVPETWGSRQTDAGEFLDQLEIGAQRAAI